MTAKEKMQELIRRLDAASDAYYNTDREVMTNLEWDRLYQELEQLEGETGIVLSNSPTQKTGYGVAEKLPKEQHEVPALSLEKTKEIGELASFLGTKEGILSWKLDGLTIVLTYEGGRLVKGVTRGNGLVGEVVTENVKCFANVPLAIPVRQKLTVRGEAVLSYTEFERINSMLPEGGEYKNPRNLCAGSVRQLDPEETRKRNVQFFAFALVGHGGVSFGTRSAELSYLSELGFDVVEHVFVQNPKELEEKVREFSAKIAGNPVPSDGLVLQYDDRAYGESLGATSKHPKDSMAFKWEDETKETVLCSIEWNASRTGRINPVAVFEPVELEGTTVTRASVHNVSILKGLSLTPGDTISVYKANMIIPQIFENLTQKAEPKIPEICPACGGRTSLEASPGDAEVLWCRNPECPAKHVESFIHAVKRDALNMEGLSEETLRKFIEEGLLSELPDLFRLKDRKARITAMEGFGEKSFQKLMTGIEAARHTDLQKLIYSLGIENVGRTASRLICRHFGYDVQNVVTASYQDLLEIPDIGPVIAASFTEWFKNQNHQELFENLLKEVILEKPEKAEGSLLTGKTFVITGSLNRHQNRDELKARIESLGGKVSGSVSSKTAYLINNDITSTSGKNKKAKDLGIPIISEDDFLSLIAG